MYDNNPIPFNEKIIPDFQASVPTPITRVVMYHDAGPGSTSTLLGGTKAGSPCSMAPTSEAMNARAERR